jgi:hypothetical protein
MNEQKYSESERQEQDESSKEIRVELERERNGRGKHERWESMRKPRRAEVEQREERTKAKAFSLRRNRRIM